jgi:molybdopterin converting factor small subunit
VKIEVRLFANLADHLPSGSRGSGASLEVPEGATVGDVVRRLAPPTDLPLLCLVNGEEADAARRLSSGDRVDLIPPLAGG